MTLLLAVVLSVSCQSETGGTAGEVQLITPEEALPMIEGEEIILIDVRTPEEYEAGHIPGSLNIPLDTVEEEVIDRYPPEDHQVMVYCRSGARSAQAAAILAEQGYDPVYDLGGILDWPYTIED
jgi:rhodanese-related sulfurtransferase